MSESRLELSGDLTVREVPEIWGRHRKRFAAGDLPEDIDLADVARTDSSALALLLEWRSRALERGGDVRFLDPPRSLRVFARITEVEELLG
ncbi:MAG: STAS domain-containing protein, partial [Wenzhouxiangella sp.]